MAPIIPRIKNSLLAGFIADAATMPVHWIYDTTKLGQALGEKGVKAPEFHSPPATPFYSSKEFPGHYEVGQPSVYGEQAVMMLEYLSNNGGFKGGESFAEFMYAWFKKYTGRYDHATKEFLEKSEKLKAEKKSLYPLCGADDDQAMHSFKIPQLTMFYRDDPKYLEYVEQAVRAHQNKDITVAFGKAFAILLKETSLGKSFQDAIGVLLKHSECTPVVKEATQYAWGQKRKAKYDAKGWDNDLIAWTNELSNLLVEKYGANETSRAYISKSCAYPGAYIVCLKIIGDTIETLGAATAALKTEGFLFGVRRNILYAGDNCGRTFLLGTLLNSIGCEVPTDMIERFNDYEAIEKLTDSIKIS